MRQQFEHRVSLFYILYSLFLFLVASFRLDLPLTDSTKSPHEPLYASSPVP
jgi:hypothetical protein